MGRGRRPDPPRCIGDSVLTAIRSPYQLGFWGVLFLVLLRASIGWHFLNEGLSKHLSGDFSSSGFLAQAVGPWADFYHAQIADVHGFRELMVGGPADRAVGEPTPAQDDLAALERWRQRIELDWERTRAEFASALGLDEAQQAQATSLLKARAAQLKAYFEEQKEGMATFLRNRGELTPPQDGQRPTPPFQEQWRKVRKRELEAQAAAWKNWVKQLEADLRRDFLSLVTTGEQRARAAKLPASPQITNWIDRTIPYTHIAAGVCLILGLLTRLASLGCAVFLASVILAQPPWVSGAAPMYNQLVEMTALLSFLFVPVGRWAGLDFFVHYLIRGSGRGPDGTR